MTREDVTDLMRRAGDAFLKQANEAGVEPADLFAVYWQSLCRGIDRAAAHGEAIGMDPEGSAEPAADGGPDEFAKLRAALVQILASSSLMLEMFPTPGEGESIQSFVTNGRPN
jgi:hypothetical protein